MKTVAFAPLIVGLVAGCATPATQLEQVRAGMSHEEVASIIGQPETSSHSPGRDCVFYTLMKDFWSRTPWTMSSRYYVCYEDGKVESFGHADGPLADPRAIPLAGPSSG